MEELLKDNMYVIDLSNVTTPAEIIFELSSVLDTEEAKNKRICLKLGNVGLNQAQLLSIKSLISGIESTLSGLDTKSVDTEKVALSLGIIVSNVSEENTLEIKPTMPYKTAEELKEELHNIQSAQQNKKQDEQIVSSEHIEQPEVLEQTVQPEVLEQTVQPEVLEQTVQPVVHEHIEQPEVHEQAVQTVVHEHIEQPEVHEQTAQTVVQEHIEQPEVHEQAVQTVVHEHIEQPANYEQTAQTVVQEHIEQPANYEQTAQTEVQEHIEQPEVLEQTVQTVVHEHIEQPEVHEQTVQTVVHEHIEQPASYEQTAQTVIQEHIEQPEVHEQSIQTVVQNTTQIYTNTTTEESSASSDNSFVQNSSHNLNQNTNEEKQLQNTELHDTTDNTEKQSDIPSNVTYITNLTNNKEEQSTHHAPEEINNSVPQKEEIQDELDVIFGSNPVQTSIFEFKDTTGEQYEQREELNDIIPEQEYTKEDIELEEFPTKYIKQTIRSGQVINYDGNIVIIGDCHPGSEITAAGDITVWGILSGIAHAGANGNQKARVRALKMNAIQLRIANCYSRRPDSMNTVYIEKTNTFIPEEARIVNFEIVVFKMND